jgi:hypothetical protein
MMKTHLLRIGAIILSVVCLLIALLLCGFGQNRIPLRQVEKIELTASNSESTATVELEADDLRQFILCYNLSRYAGPVTADRCERTFFVSVHLKDGRRIGISDHDGARMKVTGMEPERFWIDNILLLRTVQNLIRDNGLLLENWGC